MTDANFVKVFRQAEDWPEVSNVRFLGEGSSGCVVGAEIYHQEMVLKILFSDEFGFDVKAAVEQEAGVGKLLDEYLPNEVKRFFVTTKSVIVASELPQTILDAIAESEECQARFDNRPFDVPIYVLLQPFLKESQTLGDWMATQKQVSVADARALLFQMIFALSVANATTGFQHNDIKEENIMVTTKPTRDRQSFLFNGDLFEIDMPAGAPHLHFIDLGSSILNVTSQKDTKEEFFQATGVATPPFSLDVLLKVRNSQDLSANKSRQNDGDAWDIAKVAIDLLAYNTWKIAKPTKELPANSIWKDTEDPLILYEKATDIGKFTRVAETIDQLSENPVDKQLLGGKKDPSEVGKSIAISYYLLEELGVSIARVDPSADKAAQNNRDVIVKEEFRNLLLNNIRYSDNTTGNMFAGLRSVIKSRDEYALLFIQQLLKTTPIQRQAFGVEGTNHLFGNAVYHPFFSAVYWKSRDVEAHVAAIEAGQIDPPLALTNKKNVIDDILRSGTLIDQLLQVEIDEAQPQEGEISELLSCATEAWQIISGPALNVRAETYPFTTTEQGEIQLFANCLRAIETYGSNLDANSQRRRLRNILEKKSLIYNKVDKKWQWSTQVRLDWSIAGRNSQITSENGVVYTLLSSVTLTKGAFGRATKVAPTTKSLYRFSAELLLTIIMLIDLADTENFGKQRKKYVNAFAKAIKVENGVDARNVFDEFSDFTKTLQPEAEEKVQEAEEDAVEEAAEVEEAEDDEEETERELKEAAYARAVGQKKREILDLLTEWENLINRLKSYAPDTDDEQSAVDALVARYENKVSSTEGYADSRNFDGLQRMQNDLANEFPEEKRTIEAWIEHFEEKLKMDEGATEKNKSQKLIAEAEAHLRDFLEAANDVTYDEEEVADVFDRIYKDYRQVFDIGYATDPSDWSKTQVATKDTLLDFGQLAPVVFVDEDGSPKPYERTDIEATEKWQVQQAAFIWAAFAGLVIKSLRESLTVKDVTERTASMTRWAGIDAADDWNVSFSELNTEQLILDPQFRPPVLPTTPPTPAKPETTDELSTCIVELREFRNKKRKSLFEELGKPDEFQKTAKCRDAVQNTMGKFDDEQDKLVFLLETPNSVFAKREDLDGDYIEIFPYENRDEIEGGYQWQIERYVRIFYRFAKTVKQIRDGEITADEVSAVDADIKKLMEAKTQKDFNKALKDVSPVESMLSIGDKLETIEFNEKMCNRGSARDNEQILWNKVQANYLNRIADVCDTNKTLIMNHPRLLAAFDSVGFHPTCVSSLIDQSTAAKVSHADQLRYLHTLSIIANMLHNITETSSTENLEDDIARVEAEWPEAISKKFKTLHIEKL